MISTDNSTTAFVLTDYICFVSDHKGAIRTSSGIEVEIFGFTIFFLAFCSEDENHCLL